MKVIQRVAALLKEKNIKQSDFADSLGIARSTLSNWIKDSRSIPDDQIIPICKFLDVSAEFLLSGEDNTCNNKLSEEQTKILNYYSRLNNEEKDYIKGKMVEFIMEKGKKDTEFAEEWGT